MGSVSRHDAPTSAGASINARTSSPGTLRSCPIVPRKATTGYSLLGKRVDAGSIEEWRREMSEHRTWWTVRDIANHYRIRVRTMYAEIEAGRLVAHRFGGVDKFVGRDHWQASYALLSGGGMPGGHVIGHTDVHGGKVQERPL